MRTLEEIVAKANDKEWADIFGTKVSDLVIWLPFELARPWLKDEATPETWQKNGCPRPLTDASVIAAIKDYMPFAWDKANNCRGLSAGRSIHHMQAWLWLLGADDEVIDAIEHYSHYGKPQLRAICEALGIDWQSLDDGQWRESESDYGSRPLKSLHIKFPANMSPT